VFLELEGINEPILVDKEVIEEEEQVQQHQPLEAYQQTPHYQECHSLLIVMCTFTLLCTRVSVVPSNLSSNQHIVDCHQIFFYLCHIVFYLQ
jgi:hypothetical protein